MEFKTSIPKKGYSSIEPQDNGGEKMPMARIEVVNEGLHAGALSVTGKTSISPQDQGGKK